MQEQVPPAVDAAQLAIIQKKLQLDNRVRSGANWFYWIAGLSLVNSAAYLLGTTWTFVIGLGITQIVDGSMSGLIKRLGESWSGLRFVGVGFNICIAGIFVLMGAFGRKRVRWPVLLGMGFYALDGIIVLLLQDFMGALFHALVLYGIWTGLQAMQQLEELEQAGGSESIESLRQRSAEYMQPRFTPQQMRLRWIIVGILGFMLVMAVVLTATQR